MKKHHFPSKKENSCGECSVQTILSIYDKLTNINISTNKGTSVWKIIKTLRFNKIRTRIKYDINYDKIKPNSILYYKKPYDHYIVVSKIKEDKIYIYDSDKSKPIWLSRKTFEKQWSNWAIETSKRVI